MIERMTPAALAVETAQVCQHIVDHGACIRHITAAITRDRDEADVANTEALNHLIVERNTLVERVRGLEKILTAVSENDTMMRAADLGPPGEGYPSDGLSELRTSIRALAERSPS